VHKDVILRTVLIIFSMTKTKTCQNCKAKFTIEPEDFEFYKKIDVPEPTFCPECRMQRRMVHWNLIELYKRKCDFSGKDIISIYHPDSPYKVYDQKIWWSDKMDVMKYGRDYDFNKPFFEQFNNLRKAMPRPHNLNKDSVNCDYCAGAFYSKDCYLCTGSYSEDCAYSIVSRCKNCFDSFWLIKSERCYENIFCNRNYNVHFSQHAENCIDSVFLYDCRNCQNCFGCVNLRHKKYHIFNKSYSKEDYKKEIKKYDLGSYSDFIRVKERLEKFKLKFPRKYARIYNSINVLGDDIKDTKNCYYCFFILEGAKDCKYIWSGGLKLENSYDVFDGGTNSSLIYESVTAGLNLNRVYFSINILDSVYNIEYSDSCFNSSYLFGCVGLRHKKYCIFNKQYTKQEYEKMVPKIKEHMNKMPYIDKKGRVYKYGEFFPIEFSVFSYDKTIASEYFPLSKEQILDQGYNWYDKLKNKHKPTIKSQDLPDNIKDIDGSVLKETIKCSADDCAGSGIFRIIPKELEFYKKHNLPLPRFCPSCRYQERIKQRNPLKLWGRRCMKKGCSNEFQTTYAPDRKEIVYCEKCYLKEIG